MSRNSRYRPLAVVIVCLFVAVVPVAAHDSQADETPPGSQVDPERILTPDETLRLQAEQYVRDFDVSIEEAERRLKLQPFISELAANMETRHSDIYAEVRAENDGDFRVVVQVVEGGEQFVSQYVEGGPLQDIVQVETVRWTLAELLADQAQVTAIVRDLGVELNSSVQNQEVSIYVTDATVLNDRLSQAGLKLPESAVVIEVPSLARYTSHLSDLLGGIAFVPDGGCTIGFAGRKKNSTWKGVFTAGHCSNSQSYGHTLSPTYDFSSAIADVQFHANTSGEQLRNLVWIGNNTWVPITSLYWNGNGVQTGPALIYIGQQVCKMGKVLKYRCGVIHSRTYDPGSPGSIDFGPYFLLAKSPSNELADFGDSGGPWIGSTGAQHNAAFGITGGDTDYFQGHWWMWGTPIDPIFNSFEILISCPNYYC